MRKKAEKKKDPLPKMFLKVEISKTKKMERSKKPPSFEEGVVYVAKKDWQEIGRFEMGLKWGKDALHFMSKNFDKKLPIPWVLPIFEVSEEELEEHFIEVNDKNLFNMIKAKIEEERTCELVNFPINLCRQELYVEADKEEP